MAFYDDYNWGNFDLDDIGYDEIDGGDGYYDFGDDNFDYNREGPVAPAPYDPYADEGPSQPNPNVLPEGPDTTLPNLGEIEIVAERPVEPPINSVRGGDADFEDYYRNQQLENRYTPPPIEDIPDLGEMVITTPRIPKDVAPPIEDIPDLGEMVITAPRSVRGGDADFDDDYYFRQQLEDKYLPPPVVTPPPDDGYYGDPDTSVPLLPPPVITPPGGSRRGGDGDYEGPEPPPDVLPPPPPPPAQYREMINPGFIQPQAFYNTTNDAQSKFFWGARGPQFGTNQFDAQAYNQVAAPNTPWGAQSVTGSLSPEDYDAIIAGTYQPREVQAATRAEAYQPSPYQPYQYGQVSVGGASTTGSVNPNNPTTGKPTKELYTSEQRTLISQTLGDNWQRELDDAALNGDYAKIVRIQNQINAILNPPPMDA